MKELFKAINTEWQSAGSSSLRTLAGDKLWPFRAPAGQDFPVTVYNHVNTIVDYSMQTGSAGGEYRSVFIDFNIYTDEASPLNIETAAETLYSVFDDELLTVTGWTVFSANRNGDQLIRDEDVKGWHKVISYEYQLGADRS